MSLQIMNIIRNERFSARACRTLMGRRFRSATKSNASDERPLRHLILEPLTQRELVRVKGEEVGPFLQGLITNDIAHLQAATPSMYTMFLNKSGRVLYDTIVYRTTDSCTYLIECDKNITNDLRRHLRLYRVRRNIQIDAVEKEYKLWVVFDPNADGNDQNPVGIDRPSDVTDMLATIDPRMHGLGLRILTTPNKSWTDIALHFQKQNEVSVDSSTAECNYRLHRYRNGIAEGVADMPPGKCFPLEANCDFLNGVSFHKGCYIGQELTARVHHTGVIRKRHMPLRLSAPLPENGQKVQTQAGANVGTVIGSVLDRALGLLRVEPVLSAKELMIDGDQCFVEKPKWWPSELPKKSALREVF